MEEVFRQWANTVATWIEAAAALLIAIGALEALFRTIRPLLGERTSLATKKDIWLHFARWLMLGLEFELAADVIRSAISPTWTDIGQLAAIAVIRTFLNFFLERDIESIREMGGARLPRDSEATVPAPRSPVAIPKPGAAFTTTSLR